MCKSVCGGGVGWGVLCYLSGRGGGIDRRIGGTESNRVCYDQ